MSLPILPKDDAASRAPTSSAPGRLGDPTMTLANEPRLDPRLLPLLQALGAAKGLGDTQVRQHDTPAIDEHTHAAAKRAHDELVALSAGVPIDVPADAHRPAVDVTTKTIKGVDGNDIDLHFFRPAHLHDEALSAVLYVHGGAMVAGTARNRIVDAWATDIAAQGTVCVTVEYRIAHDPAGGPPRHFPAGLDDVCAAAKHVFDNRAELRVANVVLHGESGGANLCIAAEIKANREGWIEKISGVWGSVPFISGAYHWSEERRKRELPSLYECDGYFIGSPGMVELAHFYNPNAAEREDALVWPYWASEQDLKGLPPQVITANELDPLRDEGVAFYRKLLKAGVTVTGKINLGIVHAAEMLFRTAVPDVNAAMAREIASFARSLKPAKESRL